jgi:hypothetical protein
MGFHRCMSLVGWVSSQQSRDVIALPRKRFDKFREPKEVVTSYAWTRVLRERTKGMQAKDTQVTRLFGSPS